ncbi:MAG: hypothetical protein GF313_05690 [Caldithrix sp.]|nr:hypothetical protein [Caldithrix sp.]
MTQMTLFERLKNGERLLSDGGMGTELQNRGLKPGECPEAYNLEHPDIVQAIHQDYYDAGSDMVQTNTFGGNRIRLKRHRAEDKVYLYNKRAAELAREICPQGKYVAGSIGPSGEMMEPYGQWTQQQMYDVFVEQARALADGGVDILFVETMMMIEEAETALRAAKESTSLPVAATMTFEQTDRGVHTSWGVTPQMAVQRLTDGGADILGSNCGDGVEVMIAAMNAMRPLTPLPLLAQPNAGRPEIVDKKAVYTTTPEVMQPQISALLHTGINLLGGCCGTRPQHIAMMRRLLV